MLEMRAQMQGQITDLKRELGKERAMRRKFELAQAHPTGTEPARNGHASRRSATQSQDISALRAGSKTPPAREGSIPALPRLSLPVRRLGRTRGVFLTRERHRLEHRQSRLPLHRSSSPRHRRRMRASHRTHRWATTRSQSRPPITVSTSPLRISKGRHGRQKLSMSGVSGSAFRQGAQPSHRVMGSTLFQSASSCISISADFPPPGAVPRDKRAVFRK